MASSRTPRRNRRDSDSVVVPIRRGGISDARRYRPRGKTVREAAVEQGRDPYRPALEVVQGGQEEPTLRPLPGSRGKQPADAARAGGDQQPTRGARAGARSQDGQRQGGKSRGGPGGGESRRGQQRARGGRQTARGAAPPRPRRRPPRKPARPRRSLLSWLLATRRRRRRRSAPRLGNPMRRLRFGTALVLILFMVIAGRLVELQLTDASAYAADGLKQRLRPMTLPAPRGAIYDRDGATLAHSVDARYVYADPEMVEDSAAAATELSPVLGIPKSTLIEKMKRGTRENGQDIRFVYLARGVSTTVGDEVSGLNIKGIGVNRDERREVPGHDLAANLIGFTGGEGSGLAGLEAEYDAVLRGKDGQRIDEIGMNGVPIPDGYHTYTAPRPGRSVQLTIDLDLQYDVQRTLATRMKQVRATFGSAVVLDVRTGEVLAMASWPSYDVANPHDVAREQWLDYNTAAVVEPGSVHKPLVIGAAMEEGLITADSTPMVAPTVRKGGETFRDTTYHPTRKMTIPGILAHSSNVGTIGIADQLGAKRLHAYQKKFGLGARTGVGLPGEASGIVQPPDRWSGSSYGSIPIGLGVAVTPIQMTAAYAAIANDGVWQQPQLVRGTADAQGKLKPAPDGDQHRVLSAKTAKQLRRAMEAVTTAKGATGTSGAISGYRVAAKTGTGLRVKDNRYMYGNVTSFIGMAPADAPRFAVGIFAHVPNGTGSGVGGPVFRSVMTSALQHYAVPPTGRKAPHFEVYA